MFFCFFGRKEWPQIELRLCYKYCIICVRSVKMSEGNLMYHPRLAWDQAQQWGKRTKKSPSEASWEVVSSGEKVAPPFPPSQATARLASFTYIFSIWSRFFLFSPTAEPGPRLMTVTLWNLRNHLWMTKSHLSFLQHIISIAALKNWWTLKNC